MIAWLLRLTGLFKRQDATHKHRCGDCGLVWRHGDEHASNFRAHLCSNCGALVRHRYKGPLEPEDMRP